MSLRVAARLSSNSSKSQFPVVYSAFPQNISHNNMSASVDSSTNVAMDDDDIFSTYSQGGNTLLQNGSSVSSSLGMGSVTLQSQTSQTSRLKNPHKRNTEKDVYSFHQKKPFHLTAKANDLLSLENSSAAALRQGLACVPNNVKG